MTIGEFALLTGLTPKALRHYDAKGLLSPASVDPRSGYRGYALGQLREAGLIAVLRAAELPLAVVAETMSAAEPASTLARVRERLVEERRAQDAALAAAEWLLEQGGVAEVRREERGEQRFAYAELLGHPELPEHASDEERAAQDAADTERANALFARIFEAVRAAGGEITGPWWFQHRPSETGDPETAPMTLRCAWPIAGDLGGLGDTDELGGGVRLGVLPAATELSVEIPHGMTPPEVTIPPGQLALFDAVAQELGEEAATLEGIRTEGRLDEQGQPIGLTVRFPLPEEAAPPRPA